ncbi:hypothetical protein [Dyadobacter sp.]
MPLQCHVLEVFQDYENLAILCQEYAPKNISYLGARRRKVAQKAHFHKA